MKLFAGIKGVEVMIKQRFNRIETENLVLRRFKDTDADEFYSYRTNPEIRRYQGEGWCDCTYEKAEKFIQEQKIIEPGTPKKWFHVAIELKSNGDLIGDLGIYTSSFNKTQIRIVISPDYQDEGYAVEAIEAALDYTFKELDIDEVIAITDIRNSQSVNLLQKLNFQKHGNFVNTGDGEGIFTSEHLFVMPKEEWLHDQAM